MFSYIVRARGLDRADSPYGGYVPGERVFYASNDLGDEAGAAQAAKEAHTSAPATYTGTLIVERAENQGDTNRFWVVAIDTAPVVNFV